jgi:hypothetical protein
MARDKEIKPMILFFIDYLIDEICTSNTRGADCYDNVIIQSLTYFYAHIMSVL